MPNTIIGVSAAKPRNVVAESAVALVISSDERRGTARARDHVGQESHAHGEIERHLIVRDRLRPEDVADHDAIGGFVERGGQVLHAHPRAERKQFGNQRAARTRAKAQRKDAPHHDCVDAERAEPRAQRAVHDVVQARAITYATISGVS
jgi:hypothetical protein